MDELQWLLDFADSSRVALRKDIAEELGVEPNTTVGAIRNMITPKPESKMIEIESDLNMEL